MGLGGISYEIALLLSGSRRKLRETNESDTNKREIDLLSPGFTLAPLTCMVNVVHQSVLLHLQRRKVGG